jgi:hypothetical protein
VWEGAGPVDGRVESVEERVELEGRGRVDVGPDSSRRSRRLKDDDLESCTPTLVSSRRGHIQGRGRTSVYEMSCRRDSSQPCSDDGDPAPPLADTTVVRRCKEVADGGLVDDVGDLEEGKEEWHGRELGQERGHGGVQARPQRERDDGGLEDGRFGRHGGGGGRGHGGAEVRGEFTSDVTAFLRMSPDLVCRDEDSVGPVCNG